MQTESYSIEKIRSGFPSLQRTLNNQKVAYFDGPGGTQVAENVIDAMSEYMKRGVANLGGAYKTSRETSDIIDKAREVSAILLGSERDEIAFGSNTTTLAFRVARAISREWEQGEGNIVITELDHHANVDPWVTAATDKRIDINKITLNRETLTLELENIESVINEKTKLVAIGLASNAVGTINQVDRVIKRAKKVGAIVVIDAVHAVPHFSVDFKKLDANLLFCSAYKFFGPHVGIVAIKRDLFERLELFKLEPAPTNVPNKLETGTINFEGLVGVIEAINVIAGFGQGISLRERIISGYVRIEKYENLLVERLRNGLAEIRGVSLYQAPETVQKTATVAFCVNGFEPVEVCRRMAEQAIHIEGGDFYAATLVEKLGLADTGGIIRAGIAPYNTEEEVDRLILGIKSL